MAAKLRVGIVGAGMAGLTVAKSLAKVADVTIFEKSKGVGGRMATRRIGDVAFDHGAQYFTVRDEEFGNLVNEACSIGLVEPWMGDVVSLAEGNPVRRVFPSSTRYVAVPSMTALPKWISAGLDIRLGLRVDEIIGEPARWHIRAGDVLEGPFDWIIVTAPAAQTAALLPSMFAHHQIINNVRMHACFTLMITRDANTIVPFSGAHVSDPIIGWIAFNQTKPGRTGPASVVVNANSAWADSNIDLPVDIVHAEMMIGLQRFMRIELAEAKTTVLHKWRYADVETPAREPFLWDKQTQLAACGDWCIAGRVEAAYMSGLSLAKALKGVGAVGN